MDEMRSRRPSCALSNERTCFGRWGTRQGWTERVGLRGLEDGMDKNIVEKCRFIAQPCWIIGLRRRDTQARYGGRRDC